MSGPIIKKERVLVVDDEEHIRKIVRFQLEKSGYEVETAEDGIEALKAVEACTPDLILLDLMMPNMDGYEVCKRLKSDYQTNHIPVIMVTAKADLENKLQGFEDGANDYIAKPFAITELLVRVRHSTISLCSAAICFVLRSPTTGCSGPRRTPPAAWCRRGAAVPVRTARATRRQAPAT